MITSQGNGALPGNYLVTVHGADSAHAKGADPAKEERVTRVRGVSLTSANGLSIPPAYTNGSTTPLRCTVPIQGELALELHAR